jgi:hypothetical protein
MHDIGGREKKEKKNIIWKVKVYMCRKLGENVNENGRTSSPL